MNLLNSKTIVQQPNLSDSEGAYNAVDLSDLEPLDVEKRVSESDGKFKDNSQNGNHKDTPLYRDNSLCKNLIVGKF